ncbi:UDP-N-acetylmuramoyl-L-alanyl-D-glutamate--2,6-diaminopimelate ligase [Candidatus Daviesbacteria bacterium]|nr:UDP-N-acetylmuramoyl-L-alanyl-D-glutamate--2,6-diaminopimelate ligase [Candidatus Daviesbacteria bacterium]
MGVKLLKKFFFLPELLKILGSQIRRKYFYLYILRFFRSLFWLIYFGYPSRKLKLIGVTGTDGKTTVANLIYHILERSGKKVSIVSTIYAKVGTRVFDTGFHVTTPDPDVMQSLFVRAVKEGSEYFVVETTSHGLDQFRLLGCDFEVGVFTNLSHEHLDYHQTIGNYLAAKAELFSHSKVSVLNFDDPVFVDLKKIANGRVVSFGKSQPADFHLDSFEFKTKLAGEFNKMNILAATVACRELGIDETQILKAVESFTLPRGRMEEIENNLGIRIFIDFAHTPNSLGLVLSELRQLTSGRLIAVFGAAGDRDKLKRPLMGQVAAQLADLTILTDEDPRYEDSLKIISDIASGGDGKFVVGENLFIQPNRAKAIKQALSLAKRGDVVGVFGKGHERSMSYEGKEKSYSDEKAVRRALNG